MKTNFRFSEGLLTAFCGLSLLFAAGCTGEQSAVAAESKAQKLPIPDETGRPKNAATATFAAGCFWCVEEVFHQVDGVASVVSGYAGGDAKTAKYELVSAGKTDHAEAVQVIFDADKVSFEKLVELFWKLHDPTQVDRQGPDYGRQYRSAIFYENEEQKAIALASKKKLEASGVHKKPVATEIVPATEFYAAEDYHQNYARLHPDNPYIRAHLFPKLKKLGLVLPK